MMYRLERLDVLFNLQISQEMREALRKGAAAEGMLTSDFTRRVIDLGLEAWREQRAPKTRKSGGP